MLFAVSGCLRVIHKRVALVSVGRVFKAVAFFVSTSMHRKDLSVLRAQATILVHKYFLFLVIALNHI